MRRLFSFLTYIREKKTEEGGEELKAECLFMKWNWLLLGGFLTAYDSYIYSILVLKLQLGISILVWWTIANIYYLIQNTTIRFKISR